MSNFEGRFDFEKVRTDLRSNRERVRRVVSSVLRGLGRDKIRVGPFEFDVLNEFEKALAGLSDAQLDNLVAEAKRELCQSD